MQIWNSCMTLFFNVNKHLVFSYLLCCTPPVYHVLCYIPLALRDRESVFGRIRNFMEHLLRLQFKQILSTQILSIQFCGLVLLSFRSSFPLMYVLILIFSMMMCRIKEFSEWSQCIVLELVSKYVPPDSSEIFDIMNLLEDRLQHANGAVVLATIKLFLQLTLSMTDVHQQVHNLIFLVQLFLGMSEHLLFNKIEGFKIGKA